MEHEISFLLEVSHDPRRRSDSREGYSGLLDILEDSVFLDSQHTCGTRFDPLRKTSANNLISPAATLGNVYSVAHPRTGCFEH